jgi:hypothetical protein
MDIKKILAHINNKMEEISIGDERQAGPHGYGGPSWETRQKLGAYESLESLFSGMKDDNKTSLGIQEDALLEFFEWFLNQYDTDYNNNPNKKASRLSLLDLE